MLRSDGWLSSSDGVNVYYQCWLPQSSVTAVVAMVHGLGSHSGWFRELAYPLVAHGYGVYALDLRGHGQSSGRRGYIQHWSDFRNDFHQFWQLVLARHPGLPGFALGHSLGAVVTLDYALHYPQGLPGVIAIAPAIGAVGVPPIKLAIAQLLSWIWPQFTLDTGLTAKARYNDPALAVAYDADPLRHTKGTARLATEFLKTRRWLQAHWSELTSPMLLLHGTCDPVTAPSSGRLAFAALPGADKEYREYPGAYHDLHNDLFAQAVACDIVHWLERHTAPGERFCQLQSPVAVVASATAYPA